MSRVPDSVARLAVVALVTVLGAGCQGFAAPGGFGDEGTETDAEPPDLPQSECSVRRYDDCGEGQKCSWVVGEDGTGEPRCVALLGELGPGEPCTMIGDSDACANHLVCWGIDAQGEGGVCVDFCGTALGCDDVDKICSVSDDNELFLCLDRCDPLVQDCDAGWGCYTDDNKRWTCDRDRSGEAGAHGDPCTCLNCCDPGLVCMAGMRIDAEGCGPDGAAGCCGQVCDLDDPLPPEQVCPTPDERCRPFYGSNMVLKGYESVGLCEA